jgi:lipopolysaccharide transport system ATP-binding protein
MSDVAIHVESLGKLYRIGEQHRYKALRDTLTDALYAPFRAAASLLNGRNRHQFTTTISSSTDRFWALKDISFEIKQGEAVGIIGRNGAGKSTLLKILSRVTKPTEGYARIHGRIGSLLEVGTGFHPELTGRENIYLNGAIIGMKKKEIDRKFDEIVAFAEIEKFIDTPVKFYSSGMYVRLAFAVAAHLEPEILLVDEVLAVGDAAFQNKCLGKMGDVAKTGRTVLFVTHNMGSVQDLCERIIWLEKGSIDMDGEPRQTVQSYLDRVLASEEANGILSSLSELRIERVLLKNISGDIMNNFRVGEALIVEIHYSSNEPIEYPYFWLGISSQCGYHLTANMLLDGFRPSLLQRSGFIICRFQYLPLLPRRYTVHMGVRDKTGNVLLVKSGDVAAFNIVSNVRDIGFTGERAASDAWDTAPVLVPYEWHLPDGRVMGVDPLNVIRNVEHTNEVLT